MSDNNESPESNAELNQKIRSEMAAVVRLHREMAALMEKKDLTLDKLGAEVTALRAATIEARAAQEGELGKLGRLGKRAEALEKLHQNVSARMDRIKAVRAAVKNASDLGTGTLAAIRAELDAIGIETESLQTAANSHDHDRGHIRERNEALKSRMDAIRKALDTYENTEREIAELESETEKNKKEIEGLRVSAIDAETWEFEETARKSIALYNASNHLHGFAAAAEFVRKRHSRHGWDNAIANSLAIRLCQLALPVPTPQWEPQAEKAPGQSQEDFTNVIRLAFEAHEAAINANLATAFETHWPTVFAEWVENYAPRIGAEAALASLAKENEKDELVTRPEALARLRETVATELARAEFTAAVGWPWPETREEEEADNMPALPAKLLAYMRIRFCPQGTGRAHKWIEATAGKVRDALTAWRAQEQLEGIGQGGSPWERWTPAKAAELVAHVVWLDRVRGDLEREASSSTALVTVVHASVGNIWHADARQHELKLVTSSGEQLAWLEVGSEEVARGLFGSAATMTFHRLIRYLPEESFKLWRQQQPDAHIVIEGGLSGLATAMGAPSKKAAEEVKRALDLGQSLRFTWPGGSEARGLWSYISRAHAPGRRAQLTVTLSPMLCPQYAHKLPEGSARTLVPLVPLPPLVGDRRTHANQAALQWLTLARLVEGRAERGREGGVTIDRAGWRALGARVGLKPSQTVAVVEAWNGPFLERIGADRWTLANAPDFRAAREFLDSQAQTSVIQSKRGKKAAAKRFGPKRKRSTA